MFYVLWQKAVQKVRRSNLCLLHRRESAYSESKKDKETLLHGDKARCMECLLTGKQHRQMHRGMKEYENIGLRS